jgi:hypothetical protein
MDCGPAQALKSMPAMGSPETSRALDAAGAEVEVPAHIGEVEETIDDSHARNELQYPAFLTCRGTRAQDHAQTATVEEREEA